MNRILSASKLLPAVLLGWCLLLLPACGGGTTGTGGTGSSQFSGRITFSDGLPVANATVVVQETGDSTTANDNGEFAVESDVPAEHVTLLVETTEVQAVTVISEIPPGPQEVTVQLTVDKSKNEVTVADKKVKPRKVRPVPSPTLAPTAAPTAGTEATPTPSPTLIPEVTPSLEPTLDPTASPEPTVTASPATPIPTLVPAHPVSFRGFVHIPAELAGRVVRIGVVGGSQRVKIKASGAFFLKADSTSLIPRPVLELTIGKRFALVQLEPLPSSTVRVVVDISLSAGTGGSISANLNSVTVKN